MAKKRQSKGLIQVYTDGAYNWETGIGGYGAVIFMKKEGLNRMKKYSSTISYVDTTNNRMEIRGILAAIKRIDSGLTNIYGLPIIIRRTVEAKDIYTIRWNSLVNPKKQNLTISLSNIYKYTPSGWPNLKSRSDPNLICPHCDNRIRYNDISRNYLTDCKCVYTSLLWININSVSNDDI